MGEKCYFTWGVRVVWIYEAPLTHLKLDCKLTMNISLIPFNYKLSINCIQQYIKNLLIIYTSTFYPLSLTSSFTFNNFFISYLCLKYLFQWFLFTHHIIYHVYSFVFLLARIFLFAYFPFFFNLCPFLKDALSNRTYSCLSILFTCCFT